MKFRKFVHFLVLSVILGAGTLTFLSVRGNTTYQLLTGFVTTTGYVLWGFIHHHSMGNLHRKVVVEYILIGGIAMTIIFVMLRG